MRKTLFPFFHQKRLFWKVRDAFSRFGFIIYQLPRGMKHSIWEKGSTTKSLWSLLKFALGDLVWVILLAIVLQCTNSYFKPLFTKVGFTIPPQSDYGTLLASVTGVGGVFIGLYYAAISAVCSAIYKEVPNNILDLLTQERVGKTYMRFLSWLTSLSVCLLIFHVAGCSPVVLAMILLLPSAGVTIIGFVLLGTRAFFLFDPRTLSDTLFKQLRQCYTQVQSGGFRWLDQAFQKHAQQEAQRAIDALAILSEIAGKDLHLNGRPFAGLCKNLLIFLRDYETRKKSIPTDSLWYRQRAVHPHWYRTSDSETSLAHDTATLPTPAAVNDPRWLESAILPIVKRCLSINIENKRYDIVNELLGHLDNYVKWLAMEHEVKFAFSLIRDVFSHCENLLFVQEDNVVAEEPLEHMGICEQLAIIPIDILVAYTRTIESFGKEAIFQRLRRITWKSEKSIYCVGFKVHILKLLEELRLKLETEEKIEGRVVSSPWYLQELIAKVEAENLSAAMICFHDEVRELYESWIEIAKSSKYPWMAAVMISREWEYWHKLDLHIKALEQLWDDLSSDRRIKGIRWSSLDTNALTERRELRKKELLKHMSAENVLLSLISRPETYPDFAGQFLHTVGEALLTAMCENDCDTVETLFESYLYGSLLQLEQLKPKEVTLDWQNQIDLKIAFAPLLDLMELSGYVYLLSDYHDTQKLKQPILKAWNKYLDQDSPQRLQFLAEIVSLSESVFGTTPRDLSRTRWKPIIRQHLADIERRAFEDPHSRFAYSQLDPVIVIMHDSPLVRIFASPDFRFHDGIDIFIAKYVRSRQDGQNLNFGQRRQRRDFSEEIQREEDRYRRQRRDFSEEIQREEDRYTHSVNNHDT